MTTPTPTSVYRYYDRHDILIYVGITSQGIGRNFQHNQHADWWHFVARQEVEHYDNRVTATLREKSLISKHKPPFNKNHNPSSAEARAAYLAFVRTAEALAMHDDPLSGTKNPNEILSSRNGIVPLSVMAWEPTRGNMLFAIRADYRAVTSLIVWKRTDVIPVAGRPAVVDEIDIRDHLLFLKIRAKGRMPERLVSARARIKVLSQKKPVTFRLASVEVTASR